MNKLASLFREDLSVPRCEDHCLSLTVDAGCVLGEGGVPVAVEIRPCRSLLWSLKTQRGWTVLGTANDSSVLATKNCSQRVACGTEKRPRRPNVAVTSGHDLWEVSCERRDSSTSQESAALPETWREKRSLPRVPFCLWESLAGDILTAGFASTSDPPAAVPQGAV